ncbi:hypothetical protein Leryth_010037 [Lithospermum erythrorhizon]|nr:hypothetical protein Leryth_010037 [Lithospermum erythrorhizon]
MGSDLKGSKQYDEEQQQAAAQHYGTFQGIPQQPTIGFPQPAPPPGASPHYHAHAYQPVTGYVVAEGTPVRRQRPLPCCGCGIGWFLFIIGFFLGAIPWYLGAFVMLFSRIDYREKPGYIACTVAAILTTIAVIIGATNDSW